jgi:hypothetical protein
MYEDKRRRRCVEKEALMSEQPAPILPDPAPM